TMLARERPRRYVEIGSGYSTLVVKFASRRYSPGTRIVSIDPHPRVEVDSACQEVIRRPLQDVEKGIFTELEAGDVVFYDGSHVVAQNSDVVVFFLEVLPALPPGVLVQV